jgi:hypothetical protein
MILKKEHVNKLVDIREHSLIHIEEGEFSDGDVLILFNNSAEYATIQCKIPYTYRSGFAKKCEFIEFPPRCLINAVFVNKDTVVFARGI